MYKQNPPIHSPDKNNLLKVAAQHFGKQNATDEVNKNSTLNMLGKKTLSHLDQGLFQLEAHHTQLKNM